MIIIILVFFITGTLLLVSLINFFYQPYLEKKIKRSNKKVSVLIPCRNEAHNLPTLLESLIKQDYPLHEIIVYDDNSTDDTYGVMQTFQKMHGIKIIKGNPLPKGWIGKNHACAKLAKKATGDYLLFLDADVQLDKRSLHYILSRHKGGVVSVFPKQIKKTLGELLVVPIMNWLLLSFLPFPSIEHFKNEHYVAANGQVMCFLKKTYEVIGGHKRAKAEIVEDMYLAKATKKMGFPVQTFLSKGSVRCRMYRNFKESFAGFEKNFFSALQTSKPLFIGVLIVIGFSLLTPFFIQAPWARLALGFIILNKIIVSAMQKEWQGILLTPIHHSIFVLIGIASALRRKKSWKGRTY